MDLTSGTPFWRVTNGLPAAYPRLHGDRRSDVAIIGSGITGAFCAHRFTSEGIATILLDAREVAQGSTAACTALIQYEIDTHLADLTQLVGPAHAARSYQLCADAVLGIERLAREVGDGCGYQRKKSLYLASRRRDRKSLEKECRLRREIGIEVDYLTERDIRERFPFTRPAALLSPVAGELDPLSLTHALLASAVRAGLEVYDRTAVTGYRSEKDGVELHTADGCRVRARKVIFATGYETPEFLDQRIVNLNSTFALASAPLPTFDGWNEDRCLIWEAARPYFYARTTADGRAIVGGADRPFARDHKRERLLERQTGKLAAEFSQLFPDLPLDVDWTWAGTFGETQDGLPYIGTVRQFPGGYFALGYGGNGVTFSYIAANILLDLFLDRPNPDAGIFRFDR